MIIPKKIHHLHGGFVKGGEFMKKMLSPHVIVILYTLIMTLSCINFEFYLKNS